MSESNCSDGAQATPTPARACFNTGFADNNPVMALLISPMLKAET